jgi:hypothetical protein
MCNPSDNRVAGATRLELATSGVTGRRSNQLSYAPVSLWNCRTRISPIQPIW